MTGGNRNDSRKKRKKERKLLKTIFSDKTKKEAKS